MLKSILKICLKFKKLKNIQENSTTECRIFKSEVFENTRTFQNIQKLSSII